MRNIGSTEFNFVIFESIDSSSAKVYKNLILVNLVNVCRRYIDSFEIYDVKLCHFFIIHTFLEIYLVRK